MFSYNKRKKMKKTLIILVLFFVTCSGTITSYLYDYKIQKIVSNTPQLFNCDAQCKTNDINKLMNYALKYTLNNLEFKLNSSGNLNVHAIDKSKLANCIGYVTYYNAVLNKLLKDNHIKNVKLQHARAIITIAGNDVHTIFKDPSFKNHDISVISFNEKIYYIDPSLSEMGIMLIIQK